LLQSCYQLLCEIKEMGGENHSTVKAAVLEQLADSHIHKTGLNCTDDGKDGNEGGKSADKASGKEEEKIDRINELKVAVAYLLQAIGCLHDEIQSSASSSSAFSPPLFSSPSSSPRHTPSHSPSHSPTHGIHSPEEDDEGGDFLHSLKLQLSGLLHKLFLSTAFLCSHALRRYVLFLG